MQIFLGLQTKFRNCDHLVTLFLLYQKRSKRNRAYFRYPPVLHSITSMEYKIENTTANNLIDYWKEEAQQTADHFSEQTWSCELRRNLEKKTAVEEAGEVH